MTWAIARRQITQRDRRIARQRRKVVAFPGAVAIKRGNEIVAGLGIGCSPGGDKDEDCVAAGVATIADQVQMSGRRKGR